MSRFSLYFASRTMVPFVRKITSLLHTFFLVFTTREPYKIPAAPSPYKASDL